MTLKTILQPLKPFRLISLVMSYVLGAGLVQYVAQMKSVGIAVQGGIFLLLVVLALDYLRALQRTFDPRLWPTGSSAQDLKQLRWVDGLIAAALLTAAVSLVVGWMLQGILWQGLTLLLAAVLVIGGLYYLSEAREKLSPYQILWEAILVVAIPPAMAYFLQSGAPHRFLTMTMISLVPAYLAYRLLEELIRFDQDEKHTLKTVGTALGWENLMVLHNALILLTYALLALMAVLGLPWFLVWPVFLSLPIGLVEVWLMERVRRGAKPLWRVMQVATGSVFLIPLYLLAFAFWSR